MMKGVAILFAIIYMCFLLLMSLDCDESREYELKSITLFLAGLVPLLICVIVVL
jgi:hypothetical protein